MLVNHGDGLSVTSRSLTRSNIEDVDGSWGQRGLQVQHLLEGLVHMIDEF